MIHTHLYVLIQEEVMAEESTDGEVETQVYTQDSQDSIGEVSKNTEPRGNHVGPQGQSRVPPGEITWAPRGNHVGTGVGNHFLLQGIFLTWGSNLGLLHCKRILYY